MGILFTIIIVIFLIAICITFIILLLAFTLNIIEDTEFGEWFLQKIKSKWERE